MFGFCERIELCYIFANLRFIEVRHFCCCCRDLKGCLDWHKIARIMLELAVCQGLLLHTKAPRLFVFYISGSGRFVPSNLEILNLEGPLFYVYRRHHNMFRQFSFSSCSFILCTLLGFLPMHIIVYLKQWWINRNCN